jgi:hypothetical protein
MNMKLKKQQVLVGTKVVDDISLICSEEEYEMLYEFLKPFGICLKFSSRGCGQVDAYVRNPYKEAVDGWDHEGKIKSLAKEFYDTYNKFA